MGGGGKYFVCTQPLSKSFIIIFFRYLRDKGYGHDIVTDQQFSSSRDVLAAKRRRLKAEGKGNRLNRSSTITDEMVQQLWNSEELGAKNGKTLQNTLYFFMTSCFGFRGSHESRQLTWGDVEFKEDENGVEYLEFSERLTKTRTAGVGGGQ